VAAPEIERLIALLAKLPGLGPRSARRAALYLLKRRDSVMTPLARLIEEAAAAVTTCSVCGTLDSIDPCAICADPARDATQICVVEEVGDLWALDRAGTYKGRFHVLGGVLSALDGVGPEDLNIARLIARAGGHRGRSDHGALHRRPAGGQRRGGDAPRPRRARWRRARLPR
jgi:recombination protein RecR